VYILRHSILLFVSGIVSIGTQPGVTPLEVFRVRRRGISYKQ